ncbi:MAG: hypothetical protein HY318_01125, partial [Armatimonadetes bacterium]|nr:hypothetical protein [Armatimonadota bacterium]
SGHSTSSALIMAVAKGMLQSLGYTMQVPVEDHYITSKSELCDDMAILLGGRVAEEIVFNEVTTGAENDLERVTEIARRMICEFGMSDSLGPVTLGRRHGPVFLGRDLVEDRNYSEEIASAIDKEVRSMVDRCYEKSRQLLTSNRHKLDAVVTALLRKETIDGAELDRIIADPDRIEEILASMVEPSNGNTPPGQAATPQEGLAPSSSATEGGSASPSPTMA